MYLLFAFYFLKELYINVSTNNMINVHNGFPASLPLYSEIVSLSTTNRRTNERTYVMYVRNVTIERKNERTNASINE